jgi:hypothetical protein
MEFLEQELENPDCARLCSVSDYMCYQDGCSSGLERMYCQYTEAYN